MKKLLHLLFGFCLAFGAMQAREALAQSCPNPPPGTQATCTTTVADPATFLANIYQDGLGEIQTSQLALQNSPSTEVRAFAQQMIADHSAANKAIAQLAQQKKISLPNDLSDPQRALIAQLSSAPDADKLYAAYAVNSHEKAVADFYQQASQGSDADVRAFAANNVPILEVHLTLARLLDDRFDPAAFLQHAYRDGLAEIQLGQLALGKSSDASVKSFAQKMIDDHTAAGKQIQALAQQKNVNLPSNPSVSQQAAAAKLTQMSGQDFDRAYMDVNVLAHFVAVQSFQQQAAAGTDGDIRKFAADTLPTLSDHFQRAQAIDATLQPSFLFDALRSGAFEMQLANLALLKSENADVRGFAAKMMTDHGKQAAQITDLAKSKSIGISDLLSPRQTLLFVELLRMSEPTFDKVYMNVNVLAHQQAITEFKAAAALNPDADIRNFAAGALPVLNEHLNLALQVAQGLGR